MCQRSHTSEFSPSPGRIRIWSALRSSKTSCAGNARPLTSRAWTAACWLRKNARRSTRTTPGRTPSRETSPWVWASNIPSNRRAVLPIAVAELLLEVTLLALDDAAVHDDQDGDQRGRVEHGGANNDARIVRLAHAILPANRH